MKYRQLILFGLFLFPLGGTQAQTPSPLSSPTRLPSPSLTPEQASSPVNPVSTKIQPAVILITVFDPTGKLLRTGSGFFVSDTGRIITALHTMDGAVNGVAKTADNGIYNITGVQVSSAKLDLALLDAEVKQVPYVDMSDTGDVESDMQITVVGSPLAGKDGGPFPGTVSDKDIDEDTGKVEIKASIPEISFGAPVVDGDGQIIGVVTGPNDNDQASAILRPISAVQSVIDDAKASANARWPGERPTATPVTRARVVYAPPPIYPANARFREPGPHSGRYRLTFDGRGRVKSIQVLQSAGAEILDRAAVAGLQQWRSEPGREGGYVIVPLTFQSR